MPGVNGGPSAPRDSHPSRPALSRRLLLGGATAAVVSSPGTAAAQADSVLPTGRRSDTDHAGHEGTDASSREIQGTSMIIEPESPFFSTAWTSYARELATPSDGDLWPTTWADDGALYSANGDGRGFSEQEWADLVVNRIDGTPETGITGTRLSASGQVVQIWGDPEQFNRKPTGIVAVDGDKNGVDELYLAVQDLRKGEGAFDEAPTATIVRSTDYGRTWEPTSAPMFTDHVFTTIFFADFGRSNANAEVVSPDGADYVYAYGLDNNWRDSFTDLVEDPMNLWLARVPIDAVLDRSSWEFFAGLDGDQPRWAADIEQRVAVLHEDRRVYPGIITPDGSSVLSQGSVVYNPGLRRYIYLSWTEHTFEFYEAPQPWGPWRLFLHRDFGPYPWWGDEPDTPGPKNGGYATVAPSKFISGDGRTMWFQSNWFVGVGHPKENYHFSLRRLTLTPHEASVPQNSADPSDNLAISVPDTVVIDKTSHFGNEDYLNDGRRDLGEDSWDRLAKDSDLWGYTWPRTYRIDRLVYVTGEMLGDGGWFTADGEGDGELRVQVRQDHAWVDVSGVEIDPPYPYDHTAGSFTPYTLTFPETWGDGVRIIGRPGGDASFTSIAELEVYYDGSASG